MPNLKVYISLLDRLVPFYFIVDANGVIAERGASMNKLLEDTSAQDFDEAFEIVSSGYKNFSEIPKSTLGEVISLRIKYWGAVFRGQVIHFPRRQLQLFVMNLVAEDMSDITELGLCKSDFAIQDPLFEYLDLLKEQKKAFNRAENLNKEIIKAMEAAARASEAKAVFLGNMSHELRTPMTGLLGMASLLQETPLDEMQRQCLQTLMTSAENMLTLIDNILGFNSNESEVVKIKSTEFNIRDFFNFITSDLSENIAQKKLSLSVEISSDVPEFVVADREKLNQVIRNILSNAVKFTDRGGISIQVNWRSLSERFGSGLDLTILDTGIGIKKEEIDRIFEPFVQADRSLNRKYDGAGLGLTVCKKILAAMGGEIAIESLIGKGTKVLLSIPMESKKFLD